MKKVAEGERSKYPMSRLFKEDIVEIFKIFKNHCQTVELHIQDYELESIEELEDVPLRKTSNISIKGYSPHLTLNFKNFSTELYISDKEDTVLRGIKSKIDDIIIKRKFVLRHIFSVPFELFIGPIIGTIYGRYLIRHFPTTLADYCVDIFLIILFLTYLYLTYIYNIQKYSVIYLKSSKNDLPFFERNYDKLIVGLIVGLIITAISIGLKFIII